MKTIIFVGFALVFTILSCKKKQPVPNPEPEQPQTLADFNQYIVGSYSFSSNMLDSSPSNANLLVSGGTLVPDRQGIPNYALELDGNNSAVVIENLNDQLKLDFPFTVSLWTKITDSTTFNNRLFNSDSLAYYGYYISCGWPLGGEIQAGIGNGNAVPSNPMSNRSSIHSSTQLNLNQWYHVCVVFKGTTDMDMYINGVKETVTLDGNAQEMVHSSSSSFIGWQPGYSFNGSVDNVKIWNISLPADIIIEEYLSYE